MTGASHPMMAVVRAKTDSPTPTQQALRSTMKKALIIIIAVVATVFIFKKDIYAFYLKQIEFQSVK
ncbi:hypothetical protein [Serratia grimesii]|jgi:hypothetical protein|uniref:hypothetical protein n=1 Tax=Serratia grimesii TaxID=82995 RepID=UPI0021C6B0FA|nr:hypothetical protein [Serratia grimesii]